MERYGVACTGGEGVALRGGEGVAQRWVKHVEVGRV